MSPPSRITKQNPGPKGGYRISRNARGPQGGIQSGNTCGLYSVVRAATPHSLRVFLEEQGLEVMKASPAGYDLDTKRHMQTEIAFTLETAVASFIPDWKENGVSMYDCLEKYWPNLVRAQAALYLAQNQQDHAQVLGRGFFDLLDGAIQAAAEGADVGEALGRGLGSAVENVFSYPLKWKGWVLQNVINNGRDEIQGLDEPEAKKIVLQVRKKMLSKKEKWKVVIAEENLLEVKHFMYCKQIDLDESGNYKFICSDSDQGNHWRLTTHHTLRDISAIYMILPNDPEIKHTVPWYTEGPYKSSKCFSYLSVIWHQLQQSEDDKRREIVSVDRAYPAIASAAVWGDHILEGNICAGNPVSAHRRRELEALRVEYLKDTKVAINDHPEADCGMNRQ